MRNLFHYVIILAGAVLFVWGFAKDGMDALGAAAIAGGLLLIGNGGGLRRRGDR